MSLSRLHLAHLVGVVFGLAAVGCDSKNPAKDSSLPIQEKEPEPAAAEVLEVAPGADERPFFELLADSYTRIDPALDGWDTEAFGSAATAQLKRLGDWFQDPAAPMPEGLFASPFSAPSLRPAIDETFKGKSLSTFVGRPVSGPLSPVDPGLALRTFASALGEQIANPHLELKVVTVEGEKTTILVQASADLPNGRSQIDTKWLATWVASGEVPLLGAIEVLSYDEAIYTNERLGDSLFQDATVSVLKGNASYTDQFLIPTDYWRGWVPRDLGLDPVANHGLAIGDLNGDHLDDLYICQQGGLPNRLFLQQPDGRLKDVTEGSGVDYLDYCASALIVDFDNDGIRDLVVGQELRILFFSNDGSGKFILEFALSAHSQTFSLAAADFDNDGDVDVYSCGYNPRRSNVREGAMAEPIPFHDARNGGRGMLLRNDGNWEFNDVTAQVGLDQNNDRYSFAASWEDFDNDGDQDLYVANDYGRNNLYRNDDGKFVDIAKEVGVEDMSAGMSVSWADVDRDGWMDFYVSNMFSAAGNRITFQRQFKEGLDKKAKKQFQRHARGNSLFRNNGAGGFEDISEQAGVTMGRWAWGSKFADINNDGWDDLLVANGFISTDDTGDL